MNEEDIYQKYKERLERSLDTDTAKYAEKEAKDYEGVETREYEEFKRESLPPHMGWYEQACQQAEKLLRVKPNPKQAAALDEDIKTCHLNVTPSGVMSFGYLMPLIVVVMLGTLSYVIFDDMFLVFFFAFMGLLTINPLLNIPHYYAVNWRMDSSKQMVISVFYVVTYMRHTSNLEKALQFASDHLSPPLSLDFKRLLWNVETGEFSNVREALDVYLEDWRDSNVEFIEAFHLIEASLYEGSDARRLAMLDKSLDVILDGTYEKMLHFAQDLKSPINTLNMLGVILPILGLVILPLVISFMDGVAWFHISALYNVGIPLAVYFLGRNILMKRPTGTGELPVTMTQNDRTKELSIGGIKMTVSALGYAFFVGGTIMLIGFSPILIHLIYPGFEFSLNVIDDPPFLRGQLGDNPNANYHLLDYQDDAASDVEGKEIGPFGLGASLISILVPLGLGLGLSTYFSLQTTNVIKIKEDAKKLELEFSSALYQLGNRLDDGFPAELVFGKVADVMRGTASGRFFTMVSVNIQKVGMSVKDALFSPKVGAINYFPSSLIVSSMKVLLQSVKKGPHIAAQAMSNVARYIKEIHKVNERLRDLMAEIIASMNSQIKFLSPAISGIVIGITSMITSILSKLSVQMANFQTTLSTGGSLLDMFGQGLPTFQFQIIVGVYVVQLAYILTVISNGIENGNDKVTEQYLLGQNIKKSVVLYSILTFFVTLLFTVLAGSILSGALESGVQ